MPSTVNCSKKLIVEELVASESSVCSRVPQPLAMVMPNAAIHTPTATPSREFIKSKAYNPSPIDRNICKTNIDSCHQRTDTKVGTRNDRVATLWAYDDDDDDDDDDAVVLRFSVGVEGNT